MQSNYVKSLGGLHAAVFGMIAAGTVKEHLLGTLDKDQVRYEDERTIVLTTHYDPREVVEDYQQFDVVLPRALTEPIEWKANP